MQCIRCGGLMVLDQREDLFEANSSVSIEIWRCICCGAREYPLRLKRKQLRECPQWYAMRWSDA
ncbi:MAG: hypothetical protein KF722_15005 [Nitrospira sp.]|nr:hypothetical protein [Nitrospira sp.]